MIFLKEILVFLQLKHDILGHSVNTKEIVRLKYSLDLGGCPHLNSRNFEHHFKLLRMKIKVKAKFIQVDNGYIPFFGDNIDGKMHHVFKMFLCIFVEGGIDGFEMFVANGICNLQAK